MLCPACSADNPNDAPRCTRCGERLQRRGRRNAPMEADDPAVTPVPDPHPRATTAYRFAVFGMVPFAGLLLGPLALVWGILGLRQHWANPSIRARARSQAAIILGALEMLTNWVGLTFLLFGWASLP
jgi:hypothetical protein